MSEHTPESWNDLLAGVEHRIDAGIARIRTECGEVSLWPNTIGGGWYLCIKQCNPIYRPSMTREWLHDLLRALGYRDTAALTPGIVAELVAACEAAERYDRAIRQRAEDGDYDKLSVDGAIAQGYDLDELYADWMSKVHAALARFRKQESP